LLKNEFIKQTHKQIKKLCHFIFGGAFMRFKLKSTVLSVALVAGFAATTTAHAQAKWEPTKPVEFVIPAGPGGGADQMARMIQGIVTKNNLMKQSIIPVNKGAGAGAEGFLAIKEAKGDPHKIIITLSNLFKQGCRCRC